MKFVNPITGWLFIAGSVLVLIPYYMLISSFNYPDILREAPGTVMTAFHQGGSTLIWIWLAFAVAGLPLIPAVIRLGQWLEPVNPNIRWITMVGLAGLVVQMVGLLRWVFVIPVLSRQYISSPTEGQPLLESVFSVVHQYGGVVLGEFTGQLFTIVWMAGVSFILLKEKLIPAWFAWFGMISSVLYFSGLSELMATVITDFPVVEWGGFLGSTCWLIFMVMLGIRMIRTSKLLNFIFKRINNE